MTVSTVPQTFISVDIIVYLYIGSVPQFVVVCKFLAYLLNMIPIIMSVKFIAVSPYVKQSRNTACVVSVR